MPGALSRVAKLAEGRLSSSPLFSKARKTTKAQWQRASRLCCAPCRRRLARRRRRYLPSAEERARRNCDGRVVGGLWSRGCGEDRAVPPLSVWQGGSGGSGCAGRWLTEASSSTQLPTALAVARGSALYTCRKYIQYRTLRLGNCVAHRATHRVV